MLLRLSPINGPFLCFAAAHRESNPRAARDPRVLHALHSPAPIGKACMPSLRIVRAVLESPRAIDVSTWHRRNRCAAVVKTLRARTHGRDVESGFERTLVAHRPGRAPGSAGQAVERKKNSPQRPREG